MLALATAPIMLSGFAIFISVVQNVSTMTTALYGICVTSLALGVKTHATRNIYYTCCNNFESPRLLY
jgi:hypothetical protein